MFILSACLIVSCFGMLYFPACLTTFFFVLSSAEQRWRGNSVKLGHVVFFFPGLFTFVTFLIQQWTFRFVVSHTILHTPLCHTSSFIHNFVTRSLSQTTFTHTHTPSFTHNFVTHTHTPFFFVTHHLSRTTLSHTHTHTIFLCHTPSFTHNFVTYNFVTHNFVLLLYPPPPPFSFRTSPSLLPHFLLIIGRSWLVGLSGPSIILIITTIYIIYIYMRNIHSQAALSVAAH